jgi:hypothetical protein
MPLFCRHNRLTANCPICSRELAAERQAAAPARPARVRGSRASGTQRRSPGVVTKRVARAADDGYRNPLVPGLRSTADAERLATALAWADDRLEFPGPHPAVAEEPVQDEAFWLAFLLALVPPGAHELHEAIVASRPSWSSAEAPEIPGADPRTIPAYRAWAERAGSQAEAFLGEPAWSPERRFGRAFERLALPGLSRTSRYELLLTLGAAGTADLAADALHIGKLDDPTILAAKRLLVSGDRMLLERRARDLAEACALPIAALDRGLAVWGTPGEHVDLTAEPAPSVAAALDLRG